MIPYCRNEGLDLDWTWTGLGLLKGQTWQSFHDIEVHATDFSQQLLYCIVVCLGMADTYVSSLLAREGTSKRKKTYNYNSLLKYNACMHASSARRNKTVILRVVYTYSHILKHLYHSQFTFFSWFLIKSCPCPSCINTCMIWRPDPLGQWRHILYPSLKKWKLKVLDLRIRDKHEWARVLYCLTTSGRPVGTHRNTTYNIRKETKLLYYT